MPKDDGVHNYFFGSLPEMPWHKENNMPEEKIFMVTFGWGNSWEVTHCLIKAENKEKAEEKAKTVFDGAYINTIYVNELEFDNNGVHYL